MSALVLLVPIAHAGHWINGGLYLSPVLVIALLLWRQNRRDKKLGLDDEDEEDYGDELDDDEDAASP